MHKPKPGWLPLIIAYIAYIFLGMPVGIFNVAWPSIRETFALPLEALGILTLSIMIGYMLSSFSNGQLLARFSAGILVAASSLFIGLGALGYVLAPAWWVMIVSGVVLGLGNGLADAVLNTFVAEYYQARYMNWLHAFFGIGTLLGPLVFTAVFKAGLVWRISYLVVVIPQIILAVAFFLQRTRYAVSHGVGADDANEGTPQGVGTLVSLRLGAVWLGIILFILHPGIELTAPQLGNELFVDGRGMDSVTVGLWISVYWAALTAGRLVLGYVIDLIGVERLLRLCMVLMLIGAIVIWINPGQLVSFLALAAIGFGVAPMFPSMISLTPKWVGQAHAPNAIGFQVAGASFGIWAFPALASIFAGRMGLEIVGPYLVISTVIMIAIYEYTIRRAASRAAESTVSQ